MKFYFGVVVFFGIENFKEFHFIPGVVGIFLRKSGLITSITQYLKNPSHDPECLPNEMRLRM